MGVAYLGRSKGDDKDSHTSTYRSVSSSHGRENAPKKPIVELNAGTSGATGAQTIDASGRHSYSIHRYLTQPQRHEKIAVGAVVYIGKGKEPKLLMDRKLLTKAKPVLPIK